MAKAGSCKIGFNPRPSLGTGNILLNGLEIVIKKMKKPIIKIFWKIKVKSWNFLLILGLWNKNKKENKTKILIHKSKLPSWFPQTPDILYNKGFDVWEFS